MKKVLLLYNPSAGDGSFEDKLDKLTDVFIEKGLVLLPTVFSEGIDLGLLLKGEADYFAFIVAAGGDGTVNHVLNLMKRHEVDLPLGILPTGTANDFASRLGMPSDLIQAAVRIIESHPKRVDIGRANDEYFINVACLGLFTDVSTKTSQEMKNTLGKLAYFLKGLSQLPNFKRINVKISSEEFSYEGGMYLVLVFNGNQAGNMKLAYKADIDDGKLDVIVVNTESLAEVFPLLVKLIMGSHLDDPVGLVYFQTEKLFIEVEEDDLETDMDGETGPDLPLEVSCIREGLSILGLE